MPNATCPHCQAPCAETDPACPACGRPTRTTAPEQRATGWWSIRLAAPFWLAVSVVLLLWGLVVVGSGDPKGRAVLVALGAFGVLCSVGVIVVGRIRSRRGPA